MREADPVHKNLIIDRIHKGLCIPFLGAAANVTSLAHNYKGLPLATEIAKFLAKGMGNENFHDIELNLDLAKIALEFEFTANRIELIATLKRIIHDNDCEPSPLLKAIARLPFKLIITTNYDRLMERALEEVKKSYKVIVQSPEGFDYKVRRLLEEEFINYEGVIIYKLHGSFTDDDRELTSIVITEDDYIRLLEIIDGDQGILKLILAKMSYSDLLFLGYSLKDWDFRMLYKNLPHNKTRGVVILKNDVTEFWKNYLKRKNLIIYTCHIYDFIQEIEKEYNEIYK